MRETTPHTYNDARISLALLREAVAALGTMHTASFFNFFFVIFMFLCSASCCYESIEVAIKYNSKE
jgi:hypothetical protein